MKNRKKRVELIVDLIRNKCIGSQEELANTLAERGYNVTQATLSRDLKMLKTTKVPTDRGTYMYILPDSNSLKDKLLATGQIAMNANYQSGFVSLEISGNIAVIKTRNGYAAGLAYDIDMSKTPEILGTIPGSDTIFAVLSPDISEEEARKVLSKLLPLDNKIPTM
jgi:transcriptional regulator of arginine metabolism